jgi:hypothetical protein
VYGEPPRSQARADLEVRLVHYDFFRRDEDDRPVLLDDDRRLVDFLLLDREEPTFEPRLVVRRLRELPEPDPEPDPDPDSWPSMPAAVPAACWAPC